MNIRLATVSDASAIQKIYAPYVEKTAITFEYDAPDQAEFEKRIENTLKSYPYLVAEENGEVIGYAYASAFRTRRAYQHSAELSVYVLENRRGEGIGRMLYQKLEPLLLKQNINILYAGMTTTERENDEHLPDASPKFHAKMGYRYVGCFEQCGYKFGKWYSVSWMQKEISPLTDAPEDLVPFSEILQTDIQGAI